MLRMNRIPLLVAGLLAFPAAGYADDAAVAAKLVGVWEGRWDYEGAGDKLVVKVASAAGNILKGTSKWFGTAVGDFEDSFSKATLKDSKLKFPESTMDFEGVLAEEGTTMTGKWTSPMATGTLTLKKKAE